MLFEQHPDLIPSDIERLIRASAYEYLPGRQNESDREDCEQKSRIKIFLKHACGQSWENIKPQVRTIVRFTALDILRKRKRRREVNGEKFENFAGTAGAQYDNADRHESIHKHRTLLVKAYLWGAKHVQQNPSRESDQIARPMTRILLRSYLHQPPQPRCIADIGRELGVADRRRVNDTMRDVRTNAKQFMKMHGFAN